MFYHLLPGFVPAYTWIGLGANSNWTTIGNWSTGVVPGAGQVAIFDDNCTGPACNAVIDVSISVAGFNIKSTYTGTITQAAGQSVTVGASGWIQAAGTFAGGNSAVTMNGAFVLSGGTYTATSATWTQAANMTITGAPTFNHNNGSWITNNGIVISPNGITLNNVIFGGGNQTQNLNAGTLIVAGTLTLNDTNASPTGALTNGTIEALGNVATANFGKTGTATIALKGTGAQSLTGSGTSFFPSLRIDKASGTLTMLSTISTVGTWTWLQGTVDASASTLQLLAGGVITPGPVDYNNVIFGGGNQTQNLNAGTMKVLGTLTLNDTNASPTGGITNGTIDATGNIVASNYGKTGTGIILIDGTGAQSLTGVAAGFFPAITINKASGTLTITSTIAPQGAWTWLAGTVDATASTLVLATTATNTPGPIVYNNVTFSGGNTTQNLNAGTMSVLGTLTFSDTNASPTGSVNNGTINVSGNVVFSSFGKNGTAVLNFVGNTNTTLTVGASAITLSTTHIVAKTGLTTSVSLVAATHFSAAGRNFSITSGTLNLAGFAFSVNSLLTISTGGRLLCNGGTATAGSWSVLGEISCGSGQGITWTGASNDGLWSTAGNWTNNTVPGATDVALFNNSACVAAQCDAQINSNLSVRGIVLQSTYSGTLTQNATRTLTVGTAGYIQAAGTFAGGDSAVTVNGPYALSGGTYTATSGTWTQAANFTISGAPTFNHNSGSWTTSTAITISANGSTFNQVTFAGGGTTQNLNAGTMIVTGTLTLADTSNCCTGSLNNGTIEARGDVVLTNGAYGKIGTGLIKINGTGAQALIGNAGTGRIPIVEINKPSGTLTISNIVTARNGWIHTAGTVDAGSSTIYFDTNLTLTPGSIIYNHVTFAGSAATQNLNAGTMIVAGTLTLADGSSGSTGSLNNGTIEARGDVVINTYGKLGNAILILNGITSGTVTWTAGTFLTSSISAAKTGGASVILGADALFSTAGRDLNVSSGTLDLSGYDLNVNDVLTVGAGATLKCNGGEIINPQPASIVNAGTINCPGYATYDFNWTGAGGDSNWNTAGNWQAGLVPTAADVAYFNPTYCGVNCDVIFNVNPNARGLSTSATYTGTITQPGGITVTFGRRGWVQAGGTFVGGNSNMNSDGGLTVSGGSFTMTSATTTLGTTTCGTRSMLNFSGGTLSHNNGRLKIAHRRPFGNSCHSVANMTFPNGFTVYDLETQGDSAGGWNNTITPLNGTLMNVIHNYYDYGHTVNFDIDLAGDLFVNKTNPFSTTRQIRLMGSGTQEYTFNPASIVANKIKVEKATGTVQPSLGNTELGAFAFDLTQGTFVAPTGTFTVGAEISSTLSMNLFVVGAATTYTHSSGTTKFNFSKCFGCSNNATGTIVVPVGFNFYNVEVTAQPKAASWISTNSSGGSTLNVLNNFIHYGTKLDSLWTVQGNVTVGPNTYGGTGTITLNGTGAQSITAYSGSFASEGNWIINKPSGTVTMNGSGLSLLATGQDFLLQSGSLDLNGAVLNVKDQLSVSSGATVTCNNGFYMAGTVLNSGTITCANSYVKSILTDGPKAYWRLAEPNSLYPIGDSALNGTYKGTSMVPGDITYAVDRVTSTLTDKSLTMVTNGYVDSTTVVPLAATYTLEAWFKYPLPANVSWNTLFRGASDHQVIVNRTNMQLGTYDNVGATLFRSTGFVVSTLAAGWHHMVVIGSGTTMNFYVDAVNVGSVPLKSADAIRYIGNHSVGGQSFGNVDDIAVYDFALSVPQITDHFNRGKP